MTRILLCGLCPLPFENTLRSFGPGIRSWQMAQPLAAAGHEVHLRVMRTPGLYEEGESSSDIEEVDGVQIERLDQGDFENIELLRAKILQLEPEAVVGATVYGSHVLALAGSKIPFWADQFGHYMAEAQAKAHLERANWPLDRFWRMVNPVIRSADRISTVSERQRWAAVGELGAIGRLSWEVCGSELTAVIPCAMVPKRQAGIRPLLRGTSIPEDAFVVLWSGGYNVWSDADTLFKALDRAMEEEPRMHFVSTGGAIGGHDESTYRRFENSVDNSLHRKRFHLEGWVEADLIPSYQAEADLGVLSEKVMYEGQLGSKNRIIQWFGCGLPVLYNRVGDLGDDLANRKLGLTFEVGDWQAMAEQLLWAAKNPAELTKMADRAREVAQKELTFEATCGELLDWAEEPNRAADHGFRARVRSPFDHARIARQMILSGPPPGAPGAGPPASELPQASQAPGSQAGGSRSGTPDAGLFRRLARRFAG